MIINLLSELLLPKTKLSIIHFFYVSAEIKPVFAGFIFHEKVTKNNLGI